MKTPNTNTDFIIDFNKNADKLVPAVIQDINTNKILMLGYMNEEAFLKTKKDNIVTFFSRTKKRLWTKGETSGNFLHVKETFLDCDNDTLLFKVQPVGEVCHTGADTCFQEKNEKNNLLFLDKLQAIIKERRNNPTDKSYVSSLFAKGINKIAQKVGEEAVEVVIEAKDNNDELFKGEAADLLFHYLILLEQKNIPLSDIIKVLEDRQK